MRVRVNVKEMGIKDRLADLDVTIWGENLHAPLIERLLELPMDIYGGAHNVMTLHTPSCQSSSLYCREAAQICFPSSTYM